MKKLFLASMSAMLCLSTMAAGNLFINGDFAQMENNHPAGWTGGIAANQKEIKGGVTADKKAWQIYLSRESQVLSSPIIEANLDGTYTFKAFYQSTATNPVKFEIKFLNSQGEPLNTKSLILPATKNEWIAFFDQYEAPEGTSKVAVTLSLEAGSGMVKLDDFSLRAGSLIDFAGEFSAAVPANKGMFPIFAWHPPMDYSYLAAMPEIRALYNSPRMHAEYAYANFSVWGTPAYKSKRIIWAQNVTAQDAQDASNIWAVIGIDEPLLNAFPQLLKDKAKIAQILPATTFFNDLLPCYGGCFANNDDYIKYITAYRDQLKPKIVTYDYYSLHEKSPVYSIDFWTNLADFQHVYNDSGADWGVILAAIGFGPSRVPTEGEFRWQAYSSLAYGAKVIGWFTFEEAITTEYTTIAPIISRNGERGANYAMLRILNAEILQIGPTLLKLTSTGTYHSDPVPPRPGILAPLKNSKFVKAVSGGEALVGEFVHKETGKHYIMLNNRNFVNNATLTFTFALNVKALREVSKVNGELRTRVNIAATHTYENQFAAGDGRLYELEME